MTALAGAVGSVVDQIRLERGAALQDATKLTDRQRFALDPFAWLDDGHVRIYSKLEGRAVTLRAFDHQRELIHEWIDLDHLAATGTLRFRNVGVEKSRQMGETWIGAYVIWWAITFHPVQGVVLHLKASEVDDGGPRSTWRSIFGKVRYMQRNAPAAALAAPLHFRPKSAQTPATITNPWIPEAFVVGEGATTDPGRGGTFTFAMADEAARVPWGEAVHAALALACPDGKLYLSTPFGTDNMHHRIVVKERPPGWRILRHHWSQHPVYSVGVHVAGDDPTCPRCVAGEHRYPGRLTSPWYEATIASLTDEQVASEVDIDYEGSLSERVYAEWQSERHVHHAAFGYDPALGVELAWDYGLDCTSVIVCQDAPSEYRVLGISESTDRTPDQVAAAVRDELRMVGVPEVLLGASWTRQMLSRGDPSGEARSLSTGRSLVDDYRRAGFVIGSRPLTIARTVNAVKLLLRGVPKPLVVSPRAEVFIQHVRNNRWPTDRQGKRLPGPPKDDAHNHAMRAFAYLVAHKFPPAATDDGDADVIDDSRLERDRGLVDAGITYGMSL